MFLVKNIGRPLYRYPLKYMGNLQIFNVNIWTMKDFLNDENQCGIFCKIKS
jgi:hypothetical protein